MNKILLVDDSRALRTLVARHLRDKGWETIEADDGQAGLMLALQHKPDLILLDVAMPFLDGPATLLKIRSKESIRNTPVIMMTAASDRETVLKVARLGVQDYIVKPFTLDLMYEKIEKVLARRIEELAAEQPATVPAATPTATSKPAMVSTARPAAPPKPIDDPDRPNLLLVGLSVRNTAVLRNALATTYDQFLAPDGDQAIQLSNTYPPHAVILDLNDTREDPIELYKRLRYLPHLVKTPFIAIASADLQVQDAAERLGIIHFLADPIDPIALNRLFVALERQRQSGVYGANYIHLNQGVPVLRWPDELRTEKLKEMTWEIEDNMDRLVTQGGQNRLIVQISTIRNFQDSHLLLLLALQKKARTLRLDLAFVSQNPNVVGFFRQYEDTRGLTFYPTLREGWQALLELAAG